MKQKNKEGREENLLWGWAKIAVRTQSQKTLDERLLRSPLQPGEMLRGTGQEEERRRDDRQLSKAERDIVFTYRVRPQLGGPEWHKKFDTLLRSVQQLQGNAKPTGLPTEPTKSERSRRTRQAGEHRRQRRILMNEAKTSEFRMSTIEPENSKLLRSRSAKYEILTYRVALRFLWLIVPAALRADDTIKKVGEPPVKCSISSIGKDEVKYEKGGKEETVPTYEIESIGSAMSRLNST